MWNTEQLCLAVPLQRDTGAHCEKYESQSRFRVAVFDHLESSSTEAAGEGVRKGHGERGGWVGCILSHRPGEDNVASSFSTSGEGFIVSTCARGGDREATFCGTAVIKVVGL